ASAFGYVTGQGHAAIEFVARGRRIRFMLALPDPQDREITHTPTGQVRARQSVEKVYDQAVRQRWRALVLLVKAKLEAVESGIVEFETEFLAQTVLPSGRTVEEEVG